MAKLMQLHKGKTAADFLEEIAAEMRERKEPQPTLVVLFGLCRDANAQAHDVEFHAGPQMPSALEFLGLVEMGKATFISASDG